MNKDDIIVMVYNNDSVVRYCRAIHPEWEELKSQLIIQLMDMKEIKLFNAVDNNYLEYMCFVICKRIVAGRVKGSGMFYLNKNHLSLQEGYGADVTTEDVEESDYIDQIEQIVNSVHWYDRTLFNYHYRSGYKLREIAEMTGINLKSIAYTIKKTRDKIKKELNDDRKIN
jgi:hypothetical protein